MQTNSEQAKQAKSKANSFESEADIESNVRERASLHPPILQLRSSGIRPAGLSQSQSSRTDSGDIKQPVPDYLTDYQQELSQSSAQTDQQIQRKSDQTMPAISSQSLFTIQMMGRAPDPEDQYPSYFGPLSRDTMDRIRDTSQSMSLARWAIVAGTIISLGTSTPLETLASRSHDVSGQAEGMQGLHAVERRLIRDQVHYLLIHSENDLNQEERRFWHNVIDNM
ncbi:MAG: hypothetical protein AAF587_12630 [Bacteroidota bacterium]